MKKMYFAFAVAALASTFASAANFTYTFVANGAQSATPSAGIGNFVVTLDDISGAVTVNGTFSGLTGNINNQHIHGLAAPGANASVILGLTGTGTTSGTVFGSGTLSPANVTGMKNGLTYVNIHSTSFGGGEIRGQVVPEPTSLSALAGAAMLLRRRR